MLLIKPFRLIVKPGASGFVCEFTGSDGNVALEFPWWWLDELIHKLENARQKP
jgi:hypothetical protein